MVQIPNGNYSNPKYILGRRSDGDEDYKFNLKLPFDDFIGLRRLSKEDHSDIIGEKGYWANYPEYHNIFNEDEVKECLSKRQEILDAPIWEWTNSGSSTIGTTRLGIEADWKVLLGKYAPIRGNYGFRIVVKGVSGSTEVDASTAKEETYFFTNRDMYGNVYSFITFYNQQKVIDISEFLNIHSIKMYFFQDFEFADSLNAPISYKANQSPPHIPPNILFDNINVYLGISAEDIKEDTSLLYTFDSRSYTGIETIRYDENTGTKLGSDWSCEDNKTLNIAWVHYEKDNTYSVIDEEDDLLAQRERNHNTPIHIFWYRYDYIRTAEEDKFPDEDIYSNNKEDWSLRDIYEDWQAEKDENVDFESKMTRYGGVNWTFLPAATDKFNFEFTPRGDKSREKFKVVVQHDGSHITSEELIFKNTRDIEGEISNNARNDFVVIKTFKLHKNEDSGEIEAREDGSINAFYVYDENNKVLKDDNGNSFANQEYYLQIQVRNADTNKYEPLNTVTTNDFEEVITNGTSIAWALPRSFSMIKTTLGVNENDAKYFGIDAMNEPGRFENFKKNTIKFTIQSSLNNRYLDNTIGVIITRNDKEYYIEKQLMFGRAEGFGHEYLPIMEVLLPYGSNYLPIGGEFLIGCLVYNKDGSLHEAPSTLSFTWKELSGQVEFIHYPTVDSDSVSGYQITDYFSALPANERDSAFEKKYRGYKGNVIKARLKSKIEDEVNNTKPPIFEVTVHNAASYPLTARKGFMICNDINYKQVRDITIPDRVEFKSDGSNPLFYNGKFQVASFQIENDNVINYILEYPEWKINNSSLFNLQTVTAYRDQEEIGKEYSLKFNTLGNPQWTNSLLEPESYTYIYYHYQDRYVAQAIAFDRNYYASSLVNDWDGKSLTWNAEDGAILSTMIAAGTKDNNNKFTGVMMGDWHTKADESLDMPGLYGYDKGQQSFGFRTDGTGFIGNSGKGRIEFDGNKALITNADQSCYINLNPRQFSSLGIDQDSHSSNFLYCKVPRGQNLLHSLNTLNGHSNWANSYFNDEVNDYFIVDPNYGIVSTGGIIARYGKLGNWDISKAGLYQRDPEHHRFMYLGYNTMDEVEYNNKLAENHQRQQEAMSNEDKFHQANLASILKIYEDRINKLNSDTINLDELVNWYDLIHHRSVGIGLALVSKFLNECIQQPNIKDYFEKNVNTVISQAAEESWHDAYDEWGVKLSNNPHQTGYSITMKEILQPLVSEAGTQRIFKTFYNNEVIVDTVKDYTKEEFEKIINQCEIGYISFEIAYEEQLIAAKMDYANKVKKIYNHEIEGENNRYQSKIKEIEVAYNNKIIELRNQYSIGGQTYCIYAGQNEDDFKNPTAVGVEPYFSVTWDGELFARKGKIARTWTIDNSCLSWQSSYNKGLTQDKKFDRIVIGLAGKDNRFIEGDRYPDVGNEAIIATINEDGQVIEYTADTETNKVISTDYRKLLDDPSLPLNRWNISAGYTTDNNNPNVSGNSFINFGVSAEGELYSKLGYIGSWKITDTSLESVPLKKVSGEEKYVIDPDGNRIILDARNNIIKFSNESFLVDGRTGTVRLGVPYGDGDTIGLVYIARFLLSGKTPSVTNIGYSSSTIAVDTNSTLITDGSAIGSIRWGSAGIGINSQTLTSGNAKLISDLNYSLKTPSYFQIIEDGKNDEGIVLAVGERSDKTGTYSSILYPTTDGDVLGLTGHAWNIVAKNITATCIDVPNGAINGKSLYMNYKLVATQEWVNELLKEIWDEIADIWDAIDDLDNKTYSNAVTGGSFIVGVEDPLGLVIEFELKTNTKTIPIYTNTANLDHYHSITLDGSSLSLGSVTRSKPASVSLSHSHTGSASFNSDGTVTITLDKSFSDATQTIKTSNTVVGTTWYKNKLTTLWTGMYTIDKLEGQTVTVTIKRASMDGVTFEDKVRTIDVKSVYDDGYGEGYDDGYDDGKSSVPSVDKRGIWKEGWAAGKAGLSQSDCPY